MAYFGRFILLVVGTLVALAGAEAVVRVTGVAPQLASVERWRWRLAENPKIGYEPIPFAEPEGEDPKWSRHRGIANSLGFRDHEHPIKRPQGVRRILVLGDSVAWGFRIDADEDVFPLVLERLFNDEGRKVEVLNFGVSGYNTQQEVETLKDKGLNFNPDLVVLAYCLNDEVTANGGLYHQLLAQERKTDLLTATRLPGLLRTSELARFVHFKLLSREPPPAIVDRSIFENRVSESFDELATLSSENDFEVLVTVFPRLDRLGAESRYRFGDTHERIAEHSKRNGFHHLDLLDAFRQCAAEPPRRQLGVDQYHPTPFGHRCAAEALRNFILERELL